MGTLSQLRMVVETFRIRQNNGKWPLLYTTYEATYVLKRLVLEIIAKNPFTPTRIVKIGFSEFSRKVSFLRHMLLHKSYINVALAVILS